MDIQKELAQYEDSKEMFEDMSCHKNECYLNGKPMPSDEESRRIILEERHKQLVAESLCESEGHDFIDINADIENGSSDLDCQRCGYTHHCQW